MEAWELTAEYLKSAMIIYDTLTFFKEEPHRFEELKTALSAYLDGGKQRTMCYSLCETIVKYNETISTGPFDGIIKFASVTACVNAWENGCCPDSEK